MHIQIVASTLIRDHDPLYYNKHEVHALDFVAEYGGRACYQSWNRPNPATAENDAYLSHIIESGHLSVLEHGSVTFYITGVSRSLTHELIRHRHLSYSQLSQRFVNEDSATAVIPPAFRKDEEAIALIDEHMDAAKHVYKKLVDRLLAKGYTRKEAREAGRSVLPNATETRIVVTGNLRAWREVIAKRNAPGADAEIQEFARGILQCLREVAPNSVQDLDSGRVHG